MSSKQEMKLNDATLEVIMKNNGITKEQAEDLWVKSLSFNNILLAKYGDDYLKKINEVTKLTHQYQRKMVEKYKAK